MRDQEQAVARALEQRKRDERIEDLEAAILTINGHIKEMAAEVAELRAAFNEEREAQAKRAVQVEEREKVLTEVRDGQLTKRQLYFPLAIMVLCAFIAALLSKVVF